MTTTASATGTASTAGARAHARAQHGSRAPHMRHVPASAAPAVTAGLPAGVPPTAVTWAETVGPGRYAAVALARGTRVRLTDPTGDACAHLLLHRSHVTHERLSTADTVKVPWQAYLGPGAPLLSDAGRLLATVVADTSGHHDALFGTSTRAGNTLRYGAGQAQSPSPAGRELLLLAALKHGLGPRDVAPSVSFFQGVRVDGEGRAVPTGSAGPGAHVELLLQADLLVSLADTAHPLDPRPAWTCGPLEVLAWRVDGGAADLVALAAGDLVGPLAPEHAMALANTEADLLARGQLGGTA